MSVNGLNGRAVQGIDISIVKLVPRNERKVAKKYRAISGQHQNFTMPRTTLKPPMIVEPPYSFAKRRRAL